MHSFKSSNQSLDRCSSTDIDNLILDFDSVKGFDYDSNYEKRVKNLQKQMSTWSNDAKFLENLQNLPVNLQRNSGDYFIQWQHSLVKNDELSDEVIFKFFFAL